MPPKASSSTESSSKTRPRVSKTSASTSKTSSSTSKTSSSTKKSSSSSASKESSSTSRKPSSTSKEPLLIDKDTTKETSKETSTSASNKKHSNKEANADKEVATKPYKKRKVVTNQTKQQEEENATVSTSDQAPIDVPTTEDLQKSIENVAANKKTKNNTKKTTKKNTKKKSSKKKQKEPVEVGSSTKPSDDENEEADVVLVSNQRMFKSIRENKLPDQWHVDIKKIFRNGYSSIMDVKSQIDENVTQVPKPSDLGTMSHYFLYPLNPVRFTDYINSVGACTNIVSSLPLFNYYSYCLIEQQKAEKQAVERTILPLYFNFFESCDYQQVGRPKSCEGVDFFKGIEDIKDYQYMSFVIPNVEKELEQAENIEKKEDVMYMCFKKKTEMVAVIFDLAAFIQDQSNRRFFIIDFSNNQTGRAIKDKDEGSFNQYIIKVLQKVLLVLYKTFHKKVTTMKVNSKEFVLRDVFVFANEVRNNNLFVEEDDIIDKMYKNSKDLNMYKRLFFYFEIVRHIIFSQYPSLNISRESKESESKDEVQQVVQELNQPKKDIVFMLQYTHQHIRQRHYQLIEMILQLSIE
ncbi:hypothetical protein ABK040_011557 [Willaertia magna]